MTNRSSLWPDGSSDASRLFGAPIAVTASYISAAMRMPSSGGLNQRERTNSESFGALRHRGSSSARRLPRPPRSAAAGTICSIRAPALPGKAAATSALSSQRSRSARHRQIVAERAREHRAVDAARRRSRDDVDDHPQFDLAPDFAQQIEIDCFGVVFRIVAVDQRRRRSALDRFARSAIPCSAREARTSLSISLEIPCM